MRYNITSFRDITLCDEDAKVFGGHNRGVSYECLENPVSGTALGSGLNSGSCDAAQLIIMSVLAQAMKINCCAYVIFADIRTAFASLHRNLSLMQDLDGDEVWHKHLENAGSQTSRLQE